jgi:hypothetical protein
MASVGILSELHTQEIFGANIPHMRIYLAVYICTVCSQSLFGILNNFGGQTNSASHMLFTADHSETLEVFYAANRLA